MQLGDIATIKTGLVLSRKKVEFEYEAKATYKLLSLRNIGEDGTIVNELFEEFTSNDVLDEHYFTKEGDVLMRLSQPYTAVYIDKHFSDLLVPSYFAIIKIEQTDILPQYVAWYLNTKYVKFELERSQFGSRIPSTNQHALKSIPIKVPSIAKQNALMELYSLHQKEKSLYQKLIEEKEMFFQGIAQQLVGGKKNG